MNLFQAPVERTADGFQLASASAGRIDEQERAAHPELQSHAGGDVVVGVPARAAGQERRARPSGGCAAAC